MMQNILSGCITGVITLAAGALIGRFTLKTKNEEALTALSDKVTGIDKRLTLHAGEEEKRNVLVLESLLAILLTLKEEAPGQKIDEALDSLNSYIIDKGSR